MLEARDNQECVGAIGAWAKGREIDRAVEDARLPTIVLADVLLRHGGNRDELVGVGDSTKLPPAQIREQQLEEPTLQLAPEVFIEMPDRTRRHVAVADVTTVRSPDVSR